MSRSQNAPLMIIPLPKGTVLLPGIVQRIEASASRPDIAALLVSVYGRAGSQAHNGRIDTIPIACVPLASALLGPKGQPLLSRGKPDHARDVEPPEFEAGKTTGADLFSYGVAAKITGIEGRPSGGFAILVEGQARLRVDRIYHEHPYFEGKVSWYQDEGNVSRSVGACASAANLPAKPQTTAPTRRWESCSSS